MGNPSPTVIAERFVPVGEAFRLLRLTLQPLLRHQFFDHVNVYILLFKRLLKA